MPETQWPSDQEPPASAPSHSARPVEQPFDRARARPCKAVLDFSHLLGCVNVNGSLARQRNDFHELLRRDRAQAVWCDAQVCIRLVRNGTPAAFVQLREGVDITQ